MEAYAPTDRPLSMSVTQVEFPGLTEKLVVHQNTGGEELGCSRWSFTRMGGRSYGPPVVVGVRGLLVVQYKYKPRVAAAFAAPFL